MITLGLALLLGLVIGVVAGVATLLIGGAAPAVLEGARKLTTLVLDPLGQVFLRMLFFVVIPLVFATLSLGVAGLGDLRNVGRVGAKTLAYFLISTALAAALGLVLVNAVRPGDGLPPETVQELQSLYAGQAEERLAASGAEAVAVGFLVFLTSPDYIELLWTTELSRIMIAWCLVWMSIGVFVMKKMITILALASALALVGCKKKEEAAA